jgi:hypothetical protein
MKEKAMVRSANPEFVRDREGAELARMSIMTFRKLSDEFGCVYRIGRLRLTNWNEFKKCLESHKVEKQA